MKVYPDELTVVFFYNLCVSLLAAVVGIFTEPNPSAWKIQPGTALASIVCSVRFSEKQLLITPVLYYDICTDFNY